jgi:hypothetical protein
LVSHSVGGLTRVDFPFAGGYHSVTPADRNFMLFKTDLFLFHQRDRDIDQWFVGGDCAGWFYARLLSVDRVHRHCEPVMEDWGWRFAVEVDDVRVWVNVWGFYAVDNCWLFGIEARKRCFRKQPTGALDNARNIVRDALDDIIARDLRLSKRQWFAENPFQLDIKEF